MRDFSLDFFSRDVHLSQKEELFINQYTNRPFSNRNYKLEALGLITYLQMILFSDGETGFYYDVSGNRFKLLANKLGISNKQLSQVLDWCFEYDILDEVFYQKYQILTSYKMQYDYSRVLDRPLSQVRAQKIDMRYVYQCDFTQKYKNALQKYENALQKRENVQQSDERGDETRVDEIKEDEDENASTFSLKNLEELFPDKKTDKSISVPEGVNLELLAKKMKEQTWLLDKKNLDLAWCIKNYKKIISDRYAQGSSGSSEIKPAQNYTGRTYSDETLNNLYDDLKNVEL